MSLQTRINELFDDYQRENGEVLKNAALAKFVGCSRATVTDWRNGKTKTIKDENPFKVADFFKVNPEWVQSGKGGKYLAHDKNGSQHANIVSINNDIGVIESAMNGRIEYDQFKKGEVPLLGALDAIEWESAVDKARNSKDWKMVPISKQVNRYTFAWRVLGDSMEPEFIAGEIVVIEPELTLEQGDFVLVNIGGDVCVRQYWREAGDLLLVPMNAKYLPPKPLDGNTIIGVVREKTKSYR